MVQEQPVKLTESQKPSGETGTIPLSSLVCKLSGFQDEMRKEMLNYMMENQNMVRPSTTSCPTTVSRAAIRSSYGSLEFQYATTMNFCWSSSSASISCSTSEIDGSTSKSSFFAIQSLE